ncbi:electron transport complex, RnfABCDGE type, A subunit [Jonquetella anthropi DSM 22815]|uniref:Ion-translocating oxidoreductase complex subunit A n=1 Tax=Jonquetella anthropi DSM 22815 TaxID=885272 RepID=H0UM85_9BACT|nr:RnfABCDGE type electron transport complex subunit A [Jonquetella anthropi]EEX48219.1 electron transport complex, RnfABCDGE type, A subunit [Jonquetella anthropi E3_33 E1]EHM13661.1 electron transport complex, RnfABCDGE type, A subunit [Jonquetella anthropi DSM 22815]
MSALFLIFIDALLVHNIVLSQFLGICSFLGVSTSIATAFGMGAAVVFVMMLASAASWLLYTLVLVPTGLEYLNTLGFILVIAALVQFVEMVIKKMWQGLYFALGIYLPLITTNCAVLGIALTNVARHYSFAQTMVNAFGAACGYLLAICLMAGIRERLANNPDMPEFMRGLPINLVTASLMSIAFLGFSGMI